VASFNDHKIKEFKSLLPKSIECELFSAKELDFYSPPEETGKTFLENATLKAKSMRPLVPQTDWLIAEDSGLEVEALDGLPGIFSARYAGERASDLMNNDKLIKMLNFKGGSSRKARYYCSLIAISPDGAVFDFDGDCPGLIANSPSGQGGFGYDPLFIPEGFEVTMAELTPKQKNQISHRGKAFNKFLAKTGHL
jgi:XTP/dITP diphosphohydrolase